MAFRQLFASQEKEATKGRHVISPQVHTQLVCHRQKDFQGKERKQVRLRSRYTTICFLRLGVIKQNEDNIRRRQPYRGYIQWVKEIKNLTGVAGNYRGCWDTLLDTETRKSREGRKTLTPARNPAGKGERPIHHWKDAQQEVNTFPRNKRWNRWKERMNSCLRMQVGILRRKWSNREEDRQREPGKWTEQGRRQQQGFH